MIKQRNPLQVQSRGPCSSRSCGARTVAAQQCVGSHAQDARNTVSAFLACVPDHFSRRAPHLLGRFRSQATGITAQHHRLSSRRRSTVLPAFTPGSRQLARGVNRRKGRKPKGNAGAQPQTVGFGSPISTGRVQTPGAVNLSEPSTGETRENEGTAGSHPISAGALSSLSRPREMLKAKEKPGFAIFRAPEAVNLMRGVRTIEYPPPLTGQCMVPAGGSS
jgi:hypothetical protein